jgi:hypothetical protein
LEHLDIGFVRKILRSTKRDQRLESGHVLTDRHGSCPGRAAVTAQEEFAMPVQIRTMGCLASIVLSIILTIVLNVLLRACSGPSW